MKNEFAWVAVPLVAVLCAVAYVFFAGGPQGPAKSPESGLAVPATSETLADGQPVATEQEQKIETGSALAPDARPLKRESETKGDRTHFSMNHGDIGYVDVHSIMQGRNPYSIVDLLQAHRELTGADDSLEITIEEISENAIWGQEVFYRQVIDGQPVRQGGTVFFSSDGAVTRMWGTLVSSQSLNAGDILILAPEAEAMAANVAARYAENIEVHPDWSDVPVTFTTHSAEMRYELDSDSNLVRLWHVEVSIDGPVMDGVRVFISPETGEVVRVDSALVYFQATADHSIRVFDAARPAPGKSGAVTLVWKDGECMLTESLCNDPKYTTPLETVSAVIADVKSVSHRHIKSPINIMVNYPKRLLPGARAAWRESNGTIYIRIDQTDLRGLAAHEAFHAASRSPQSSVEEGLVYAMNATWGGGNWEYVGTSVTSTHRTYSGDGPHTTNILYRIAQKVGNAEAFQFVLEVDLRMPSSIAELVAAMQGVAEDLEILDEVNEVIVEVEELEELQRLRDQAEREGLSHTQIASRINRMTNQQMIEWLREWLRDYEDRDDQEQ